MFRDIIVYYWSLLPEAGFPFPTRLRRYTQLGHIMGYIYYQRSSTNLPCVGEPYSTHTYFRFGAVSHYLTSSNRPYTTSLKDDMTSESLTARITKGKTVDLSIYQWLLLTPLPPPHSPPRKYALGGCGLSINHQLIVVMWAHTRRGGKS